MQFVDILFSDRNVYGGDYLCNDVPKPGEGMIWIDPDLKQRYLFQVERTVDYKAKGKGPIPETTKAVAAVWLKRIALI